MLNFFCYFRYSDKYIEIFESINRYTDINVNIELLHPRSEGSITLRSRDPRDFPIIDPNYFSDPQGIDLENMYKGVQVALKFNNTETFRKLNAQLVIIPYPECDDKYEQLSKDWWHCAIKTLSSTVSCQFFLCNYLYTYVNMYFSFFILFVQQEWVRIQEHLW